jgi:porphobilinogen synthase
VTCECLGDTRVTLRSPKRIRFTQTLDIEVSLGLVTAVAAQRSYDGQVSIDLPIITPTERPRRLRRTPALRRLVAETRLGVDDLIAPLFVREGIDSPIPIHSLPGVSQHSLGSLLAEARQLRDLGVPGLILFGVPVTKDAVGSGAFDPNGIVQVALRMLRNELGDDMVLMADLCVDEYTDHGHCGIVDANGHVDNDATLTIYQQAAVAQAVAGAHVTAPSGMMDGQVGAIRAALDANGYGEIPILAYAAKYASGLYGPFRDAVDVQIAGGGDRKGYQQDWRNVREALEEVKLDLAQGADMVMVKPAVTYLDVIAKVRTLTNKPLAAYHVSGEYAMLKAAAANGWIDGDIVALEQLTAIKRAGADMILTYLTREIAEALQ